MKSCRCLVFQLYYNVIGTQKAGAFLKGTEHIMELKRSLKSELEKLKKMSAKDKIWYIFEYYKFHMIAILFVFVLLWVVGSSIYRQTFTTRLTLAVVNDYSGGNSSMDPLESNLKEALGCGKKDLIEINSGLFVNTDETQSSEYSYASMAKIAALSAGGNLDIMIADPETLKHYESQGAFLNLSDFLPEDLKEHAEKEGLFLYTDNKNGQSEAAAISLDSTDFADMTGATIQSPYLAVIASSQHTEDTLRAICWLFGQK